MIARDALIQEGDWAIDWLARLAENARVQDEPASGYNPSGDAKPLRIAAERASRLIRDLLTLIQNEDLSRVDGERRAAGRTRSTASGNEVVPSPSPDLCMPNPQCSCCECRGVKCLVGHPGHSHRSPGYQSHPWRR